MFSRVELELAVVFRVKHTAIELDLEWLTGKNGDITIVDEIVHSSPLMLYCIT